jgi:hypothetical protein
MLEQQLIRAPGQVGNVGQDLLLTPLRLYATQYDDKSSDKDSETRHQSTSRICASQFAHNLLLSPATNGKVFGVGTALTDGFC